MANVLFKKGLRANLPQSYTAGTFYVTTDERAMYLDINDNTRIRLGDFQEFSSLDALKANTNPSTTAMYYVSDLNVLAKWNGVDYVQINPDTGVTSVEVVGEGNAVTAASYNPATRKLTLTKGEAFATKSELDTLSTFVGEIPTDYTEETIVAYINKKAEETLNSATGEGGHTAASVKAALDAYKALNDPKVQANTDAIAAIKNGTSVDSFADVETELAKKVDKVEGKSLVSDSEITKLAGVSAGANKVAASANNGSIKIDGVETVVYTHPASHTVSEISDFDNKVKEYNYATKAEAQGYADAKDDAIAAAKKAGDDAQAAVDAIEADYLKKADKDELSTAIAGEKTRAEGIEGGLRTDVDAIKADYLKAADKTALQEQITANADAIELLTNGVSAEEVDGVNDLIQYVKDHGTEVTGMKADIAANTKAIADQATADEAKYETKTDAGNKLAEAKGYTDTAKEAVIGTSEDASSANTVYGAKKYAEEKASAAESAAKTHADGLNTAMNTRVEVLEKLDHEAYKGADAIVLQNAKDYADQAEADAVATAAADATEKANAAKTYADGLNTAMNTRVAVLEAIDHEAYKAYADQAEADAIATASADATAKAEAALVAAKADSDSKDAVVLVEAQGYANQAKSDAIATASEDATTKANNAQAAAEGKVNELANGAVATNTANIAELTEMLTWGSF